jgi:hypothetical protein
MGRAMVGDQPIRDDVLGHGAWSRSRIEDYVASSVEAPLNR